jgi:hypothetical protein
MEKISDWMNEKFLAPPYKPHKMLGEWGWILLMIGIFVEIADAGMTAIDAWQANPLNRPISSVYAVASFEVESNSVRNLPLNAPNQIGGLCLLALLRDNSVLLTLDGKSCDVLPLDGKHFLCIIKFGDSSINSWAMPMAESGERARDLIGEINGFEMIPLCLTEHAKIFGGKVKLVFNGSVRNELQIPATEVSSFDGGRGWKIRIKINTTTDSAIANP